MSILASIRPGSWDLPLFLHVLGGMVLVGAAATAVKAALAPEPVQAPGRMRALALRSLLFAALPAFVVMRVGAEWIRTKEYGGGPNPRFVIAGYTTADVGAVFLIAGIVLAWLAVRRGKPRLARWSALVIGIAAVGWFATVVVMGAKPS